MQESIDKVIQETGLAFIYNPHNNKEIFTFEKDYGFYWIERHRIIERNGGKILTTLIHLQDRVGDLNDIIDLYPEWAQQEVYGKECLG